jgi:hypothetical protein
MKRDAMHSRGQGLVEFALIVPLFLILLVGMVEFGRAWMTKNIHGGSAGGCGWLPHDNVVQANHSCKRPKLGGIYGGPFPSQPRNRKWDPGGSDFVSLSVFLAFLRAAPCFQRTSMRRE